MKLSIITINRNNKDGLRKTIESVVNQTFSDYEYIVIDGASNDGSVDVIKQYEGKITYWVSEPDKGIYNAMNKGILQAKGEYCLFLNSGDWLVDENILREVFIISSISEDIVYGRVSRFFGENNVIILDYPEVITLLFFFIRTLPHQASFIKRSLFNSCLYSEDYEIVSDFDFFIKSIMINKCTYKRIDHIVADLEPCGISSQIDVKHLKERDAVLQKLIDKTILEDYRLLCQYVSSPLSSAVLQLKKTTGFEKLVAKVVQVFICMYSFFRKI